MFDLEQAIANWRRDLSRSASSEAIAELESHLRDEIDAQLHRAVDPQRAFTSAVQRVGDAATLRSEFAKTATLADRAKDFILTLSGVPIHVTPTTMSTSHTEPAWATYLKTTAFLLPAIFLALLSAVFVVPKLQQICVHTGFPESAGSEFWNLTYSSIQTMLFMLRHGALTAGATILLLVLLEWRWNAWPRYRRATLGLGAFALNTIILFALFIMILAAIVAAPAMARPAQ